MGVLDQTHFVQDTAHIALLFRTQGAITDASANGIQACFNAHRQIFVGCKGVPNDRFVFEQGRQFGVKCRNGPCFIHIQCSRCGFRSQSNAIPNFTLQIFGLAKQSGTALRGQNQASIGLRESSEVIKITVMPEQKITVTIALTFWRCGNDGDAVGRLRGHVCGQLSTALCVQI